MLQCGARGAVRLGKEVSVHIPGFSLPEKREGSECEGKGAERWMERRRAAKLYVDIRQEEFSHPSLSEASRKLNVWLCFREVPGTFGSPYRYRRAIPKMTTLQNIFITSVNKPHHPALLGFHTAADPRRLTLIQRCSAPRGWRANAWKGVLQKPVMFISHVLVCHSFRSESERKKKGFFITFWPKSWKQNEKWHFEMRYYYNICYIIFLFNYS